MVLPAKLNSLSVRPAFMPLRPAVAKDAGASLPTPSSRPIDSEEPKLFRFSDSVDQAVHAALARITGGLSPAVLAGSLSRLGDPSGHLAREAGGAPREIRPKMDAARKLLDASFARARGIRALHQTAPTRSSLQHPTMAALAIRYLLSIVSVHSAMVAQQNNQNAGVSRKNEEIVEFVSRQLFNITAPSNFLLTNPVVMEQTLKTGGENLTRGLQNFVEDAERQVRGKKPVGTEFFQVGRDVTVTPGKVSLSKSPYRADPVFACYTSGPARTNSDRACLDNEILHSRPFTHELASPLSYGTGLYGVYRLLA